MRALPRFTPSVTRRVHPLHALRQRGQALVEYSIAAAVLAGALFVVEFQGRTAAAYLADAVRAFFRNLTYFISLP